MNQIRSMLAAVACCQLIIFAANSNAQTGKKWIDMDYGPNMTHSFQVAEYDGRNIAYKGLKVSVSDDAAMLFDEDLLRWAGGWTDCELDWRNVIYDGSHGTHPKILGNPTFANDVVPGWSLNNDFSDPRTMPYGPLEKTHSRFEGLYRNGDRIVVQFSVGSAKVLESASLENGFLTRTINLAGNDAELFTQLLKTKESKVVVKEKDGVVYIVMGEVPKSAAKEAATETEDVVKGLVGNWGFSEDGKQIVNFAAKAEASSTDSAAQNQGAMLTPGPKDKALSFDGKSKVEIAETVELGSKDFTITGWVKTKRGGTIAAKGPKQGKWSKQGKSLFVRGGKLVFDVGWVGAVESGKRVADGKWHSVAVSYDAKSGMTTLYVDGKKDGTGNLLSDDNDDHVFRLGYTATNFAPPLKGSLDDIRFFQRKLDDAEVAQLAGGVQVAPQLSGIAISGSTKDNVIIDNGQVRLKIPANTDALKVAFFKGDANGHTEFETQFSENTSVESLKKFTTGGPANYPQKIVTVGLKAADNAAYVTDDLTLPHDNPWNSWMRIGGFDFYSDPTKAALCTWSGDVWTVSGIDGDFEKLTWRRIATGMFQPLGLKIINDEIFVGCRDQITKLVDLNGDGETDFYQTFNNDHQVTEHFHEFAMDLQTDADGNFYYAKSARHALDSVVPHHGTLIRVSKDGLKSEIVCNGFRAANGVGLGPNGEMATSDQEGHWTPANRINLVNQDGFYGNMYSYHRGDKPTGYDPPLVWLPKNVDRSPASQLWCTSKKWGPFYGKLLSTSYGTGKLWHVMHEEVDGTPQGGVVQFPLQFPTGVMRGRFHPTDGQLYTCGLFGLE